MTTQRTKPMTMPSVNRRSLLAASAAGGLALAGVRTTRAQDKPEVSIGSKDFTEQILINEIQGQLLEAAGYSVERNLNLGGTIVVHQALVNGDIDTYVEYTGTGLLAILEMELPEGTTGGAAASPTAGDMGTPMAGGGMDAVYEIVKAEYQAQFNLVWLDPLGFNNTYVLVMRPDQAAELGVTKISDLAGVAGDLTFGATQEFLTRPDGLPGIQELYGIEFGEAQGFDPGLVYQALTEEDVDIISGFATDGQIAQLGLTALEDDLGFFPPYFACPVVRQELLDEDPAVREVLNQLAGKIDDATMAGLNARVAIDQEEAEDVARAFLQEQGLVSA